jgi:rare lipoprotein A
VGGAYSLSEEGIASYYADEFNGRTTSNGEVYDMNKMTAAHRTLPFNTKVLVTNTGINKSVIVRINDRGPFKDDRVIDLSLAAAKALELIGSGTAHVKLQVVELGDTVTAHERIDR